nr:MAG TPA: hypothetical protein [Bacteriophage sp.]
MRCIKGNASNSTKRTEKLFVPRGQYEQAALSGQMRLEI